LEKAPLKQIRPRRDAVDPRTHETGRIKNDKGTIAIRLVWASGDQEKTMASEALNDPNHNKDDRGIQRTRRTSQNGTSRLIGKNPGAAGIQGAALRGEQIVIKT